MFKPFRSIAPPILAIGVAKVVFGFSSPWMAQVPPLPPPPPTPIEGTSENTPLCYIRISGSTVDLHQLCGMPPNQARPTTNTVGIPNVSNRSNSPLSNALEGNQRAPVRFGTGSAYADDGR